MKIIVQKFGGTSVATPAARDRLVQWVGRAREEGYSPVVVVSAMGRAGEPYATDTLINVLKSVNPDPRPRELDLIMACGEIISAALVSSLLERAGYPAVGLTGGQAGILTDDVFNNSSILHVDPSRVLNYLREGKVVVVAGFQGVTEQGDLTTLGRGGSDTTATALGAALRAEVVEIYTDVDGVKTADPRLVPDAQTIEVMSYEELSQMAHLGAKVIHPRAVEIAMRHNIPVRVKSTFEDSAGTLITYGPVSTDNLSHTGGQQVVTGVTHIPDVAQIKVRVPEFKMDETEVDVDIFKALANAGISVDLINVSPESKSFIVKNEVSEAAARILAEAGFVSEIRMNMAKVSVVGAGMRGVPGVMARVVEALHRAGVKIYQTADSHLTISCLVRQEDMVQAVRSLHDAFNLAAAKDRIDVNSHGL